jgi:FeS assembly SUF system protein
MSNNYLPPLTGDKRGSEIAKGDFPRDKRSSDVGASGSDQTVVADRTAPTSAMPPEELEAFGNELIAALKTVYDPEIPVDIYELGLIYKVDVADNRDVTVDMTLTAPGCPVAGEMPNMVRDALLGVPGIGEVTVNMTFDPPWTPDRMSEEAKLELNMF